MLMRPNETLYVSINNFKNTKSMAIRINDNGTVVIERVLKVTKELETLNISSFEDNFNRMMRLMQIERKNYELLNSLNNG